MTSPKPQSEFERIVSRLERSALSLSEVMDELGREIVTRKQQHKKTHAEESTVNYLQELSDFLGTEQFPALTRKGIPRRFFVWEGLIRRLAQAGQLDQSYLETLLIELDKA